MGFRLQRSIRLGKFVRLNISKSGVGFSAGITGLRISHGPSGTHFTAGLPGTGLSYRKKLGSEKNNNRSDRPEAPLPVEAAVATQAASLPEPGFFAPGHEKALARALEKYQAGQIEAALEHFLEAGESDPGAAIFAAALLARRDGQEQRGIELLEKVIVWEDDFPTELMQKYLAEMEVEIDITPNVTAILPLNALAATLLLVELYQKQRRVREAIALLEEVEALAGEPVLTLSLCELYTSRHLWDNLIERAKGTEPDDDLTLETVIFYGRALYEKGLAEAAIAIFNKALRRRSGRNPVLLHEAVYWRALIYQEQGKLRQANSEFQKLFAAAPDFRDVAARLADFSLP
jgi:tetratricopeptide (TPR) repeat protein